MRSTPREEPEERDAPGGAGRRPRLVCLLPARNATADLPRWFESVAVFADAVVALDDGSTDGTARMLDEHPLVEILLRNPRRPDHSDWDDSGNRNRLLDAARALDPDWIISIDSDQILPPEDGAALRQFVDDHATPGIAYGFSVYRMIGDLDHFDVIEHRAYRLFSYRPGQVFPSERLHFEPVPTSIPRCRWLATDLRIQHLGELTPERRRARREKYREADPAGVWLDYSSMGATPGKLTRWSRRRPGTPVVLTSVFTDWAPDLDEATFEPEWPVLSVVLIVEEPMLDEMLDLFDAVIGHECHHPLEILVVTQHARVADDFARLRPSATVLVAVSWASRASCRNIGLRVARGEYVVCFDAPAAIAPGAFDTLVEEHDRGRAVVSGCIENLTNSAPGWATFFAGPGYASFARESLLRIGGFDEWTVDGIEARARDRLTESGHQVATTSLITFGHHCEIRNTNEYVRSCLERGRALARRERSRRVLVGRVARREVGRVVRAGRDARRRPADLLDPFRRIRTILIAGAIATCLGAALEQVRLVTTTNRRR